MPGKPLSQAFNLTRGAVVAARVELADDYESRSRGLLGRDLLPPGEALWIGPCPCGEMIHTFFMRFAIDVIFLDKNRRVVRVIERLKPWRLTAWVLRARSVLELPAGTLDGSVRVGDEIELRPAD